MKFENLTQLRAHLLTKKQSVLDTFTSKQWHKFNRLQAGGDSFAHAGKKVTTAIAQHASLTDVAWMERRIAEQEQALRGRLARLQKADDLGIYLVHTEESGVTAIRKNIKAFNLRHKKTMTKSEVKRVVRTEYVTD